MVFAASSLRGLSISDPAPCRSDDAATRLRLSLYGSIARKAEGCQGTASWLAACPRCEMEAKQGLPHVSACHPRSEDQAQNTGELDFAFIPRDLSNGRRANGAVRLRRRIVPHQNENLALMDIFMPPA